jgi:electron transport complex protein RnfC
MKVYSFPRGGLSFDDPTAPSRDSSAAAFLPGLSVIPLIQHSGDRAYPVVFVGDMVKEGMLIGRGRGQGSANVHSPVPGRVVRSVSWQMGEGFTNEALVIRMEGGFERLGKREEIFPWEALSTYELQRIIAEHGVVEMEGTGRPVADMISALRSVKESLTLVVRCVFDDPWLAADYVLCRERLKAVAEGCRIMIRAGRMGRVVFAVSQGEKELGEALLAEAEKWEVPSSLVLTGSRYPQRNRRELELVLRNYEKKEALTLGSLFVLGPATLAAVHDAVRLKKPILDRYVAVGGSAIKYPQVMKVRIGTRIGEILAECGGFTERPKRIATGSPLLGRTISGLDEPVMKTTYAVFAMLGSQTGASTERNCIGCGECREICPVGLDPEELYKLKGISRQRSEDEMGCHGCGCCEVVCPSRLPLSRVISGNKRRGE